MAQTVGKETTISNVTGRCNCRSIYRHFHRKRKGRTRKVPQTELIAPLRLGQASDIKAQAPLATILARHNGEISAKELYQRFGGEIDAFYAQLKIEVSHGWILEPEVAEMSEKFIDRVSA